MSPGSDDDASPADMSEGPVLSPEELDIADDERVRELEDGRYVVSSGEPIAETGEELAGQLDGEAGDTGSAEAPTADGASAPEPASGPDSAAGSNRQPAELDPATVHDWLAEDLAASDSRYGFDITAAFDGSVDQQRMVSNDVVTIFESLVMWYAQRIDRNTPVEEVLGILLMEANVPVRYPPKAVARVLDSTDLSPEDSIADLLDAAREDEGLEL